MYSDYFEKDKYWEKHINKKIEEDMWLDKYVKYLNKGKALDLGCGIGQYSKKLMELGYSVVSSDISEIALSEVSKFNKNILKLNMLDKFPFENEEFDLVFANLSIHYFYNDDTIRLFNEIYRVLKIGGVFMGSVNSIEALEFIKEHAQELEYHFYYYNEKNIRLFDVEDLKKYLFKFEIIDIEECKTIRFTHNKNYIIFVAKKIA